MINEQEKEEDNVNKNKMASPRGSIEQLICQLSCGVICGIVCMMVTVTGQDDFGDDAMDMDMDAMMGGDGGKVPGATTAKPVIMPQLTYIEQSTRALQQLAIVIGVGFMVGFLFMMMVGLEKAWDNLEAKYNKAFGKITVQVEDPAALVGTFKRYKN